MVYQFHRCYVHRETERVQRWGYLKLLPGVVPNPTESQTRMFTELINSVDILL